MRYPGALFTSSPRRGGPDDAKPLPGPGTSTSSLPAPFLASSGLPGLPGLPGFSEQGSAPQGGAHSTVCFACAASETLGSRFLEIICSWFGNPLQKWLLGAGFLGALPLFLKGVPDAPREREGRFRDQGHAGLIHIIYGLPYVMFSMYYIVYHIIVYT